MARVDPQVAQSIPEQLARRFNVVPVGETDSYLEIATANPFDIDAEKVLAFATGREVRMLLASPARLRAKVDELYRSGDEIVSRLLEGISGDLDVKEIAEEEEAAASAEEASQRPIIRLVDMMLADGVASRASDVHVEPIEGGVVVRYRIDGVLRQVMKIPRNAGLPLISRIKIMSGLDIADRLRPQDGRARVSVNGEAVDLRVSTLPASLGEKVVIRILSQRATVLSLDALGHARGRAASGHPPVELQGRHSSRHRADGLRQDDHALLRHPADPERGRQHRDGRGPGRIPAGAEHRAGPGAR